MSMRKGKKARKQEGRRREWNGMEGKGRERKGWEGKGKEEGKERKSNSKKSPWGGYWNMSHFYPYYSMVSIQTSDFFLILNIYSLFTWFWPIIEKNIRRKCHYLHNQEIEYSFLPLQATVHDKNIYFEKYRHLWKCTHNRECQVQEIDVCIGLTFKIKSSFQS